MRQPGSPLGTSYVLEEVIGRGPNGEVWKAAGRAPGLPAAIKVLSADLAGDPELVSRFLAERSLVLGLRHPNLVRVRDLVAEGGTLAIVMDLVPGEDLHALLRRTGPLDPRAACGLLSGVARALATVHAAGLVHGDVKPTNVLVNLQSTPPVALLTDVGMATIAHAGPGTGPGTSEYTAPELVSGARPTPAADLYACGVVLYEAVTGQPPFRGADPDQTRQRHVEQAATRPEGLADDMWEAIASLLAKWPGSRPGAEEAALHLTSLAGGLAPSLPVASPEAAPAPAVGPPAPAPAVGPPPAPERPGARGRRLLPPTLGAGAILAAVVAAAVLLGRGGSARPATYHFPAETSGGVSVQRTWALAPSGTLTEQLQITNAGTTTTTGASYDEVIPKSLAATARSVTFSPQPQTVVRADPVVRYTFGGLAPGDSREVAFTVHVARPGTPERRLASLAGDQRAAESAYRASGAPPVATLASLSVVPPSVTMQVGKSATLAVSGTMSDGSPAAAGLLQGVTWTASAAGIGDATGTVVRATGPGRAHFTATVGSVRAGFDLIVTAASPTPKPDPPPTRPGPTPKPSPPSTKPSPPPSPDQAFPACAKPPSPQPGLVTATVNAVYLFRLCNPKTGFRLYTTSATKIDQYLAAGDAPEGILAVLASVATPTAVPLYELQDAQGRQYIATSAQRISQLAAQVGAQVVGTLGYAAPSTGAPGSSTVPLYELGSTMYGSIYTREPGERSQLLAAGWKDLGIVYYVP
ncbi:MAG TPA: protein kinase [Actinomycetota bacterium]|nr:protein kinase [Actinomycetota bacterium]